MSPSDPRYRAGVVPASRFDTPTRDCAAHSRTAIRLQHLREREKIKAHEERRHPRPLNYVRRLDPQHRRHAIKPACEYRLAERAQQRDLHRRQYFSFSRAPSRHDRRRAFRRNVDGEAASVGSDDNTASFMQICWNVLQYVFIASLLASIVISHSVSDYSNSLVYALTEYMVSAIFSTLSSLFSAKIQGLRAKDEKQVIEVGIKEGTQVSRIEHDGIPTDALDAAKLTAATIGAKGMLRITPLERLPQRGGPLIIAGTVQTKDGSKIPARCLLDSGSYVNSFRFKFAAKLEQTLLPTPESMEFGNSACATSYLAAHTELDLAGHTEALDCYVAHESDQFDIILGAPWFAQHSPAFSNGGRTVTFRANDSTLTQLSCKGLVSSAQDRPRLGLYASTAASSKRPAEAEDKVLPVPKKKRVSKDPDLNEWYTDETNCDLNLPAVTNPILAQSNRVIRWLNEIQNAKLKLFFKYTPDSVPPVPVTYRPIGPVMKLQDFPVVDGRDFYVTRVWTFATSRQRETRVTSWGILVNNRSSPLPNDLELYHYGFKDNKSKRPDGPIENSFCLTENDAQALGTECCKLFNRLPCPLQEDKWTKVNQNGPIYPRLMVEALALDIWRPGFDYNLLHPFFIQGASHSTKWFRLTPNVARIFDKATTTQLTAIGFGQTSAQRPAMVANELKLRIFMDEPQSLNYDLIEKIIPEVPQTFFHKPSDFELEKASMKDLDRHQQRLIQKLVNWICHQTVGCVGTHEQLQAHISGMLSSVSTPKKTANTGRKARSGPFGGRALWIRWHMSHRMAAGTALDCALNVKVSGHSHTSRLAFGHAMNAGFQEARKDGNAAQAWHAVVVALAAVETEQDTREDIIRAQWADITETDKENHIRACMICNRAARFEDLVVDDNGRLVCTLHEPKDFELSFDPTYTPPDDWKPPESISSLIETSAPKKSETGRVRYRWDLSYNNHDIPFLRQGGTLIRSIKGALSREEKESGRPLREQGQQLLDKLKACVKNHANGLWQDAYNGILSTTNAAYEGLALQEVNAMRPTRRPAHPDRESLEAVHPFWRASDGQTYIHHQENVTLASYFLNTAKLAWAPAILPLLRLAAAQTKSEKERMVAEGKRIRQVRDFTFWSSIRVAMDHIHAIALASSNVRKTRLRMTVSMENFERYLKAWRTGIWTEELQPLRRVSTYADNVRQKDLVDQGKGRIAKKRSLKANALSKARQAALPEDQEYRKFWPKFTQQQKSNYARLIQEMRADTIRFNPDNIEIRTVDGAPWPFPEEYFPNDDSDLWEWWYRFALYHYWKMDDDCDLENETQESPATIMLFFVERYFATGGGFDEFVHLQWVPWGYVIPAKPQSVALDMFLLGL